MPGLCGAGAMKRLHGPCAVSIGASCLLFASAALAQNTPKSATFLKGECGQLTIPTGDLTSACKKALVNMIYADGRSSFMFSDGDQAMISFSGFASQAGGGPATETIDHVSIATPDSGGTHVASQDAQGSCTFADFFAGQATIRCSASTPKGSFTASFTTDGSKPDVVNF